MGTIQDRCLPYSYLLGRTTNMRKGKLDWNGGLRSEQHPAPPPLFNGGDSTMAQTFFHTIHWMVIPNNAMPTERKSHICTRRHTAKKNGKL